MPSSVSMRRVTKLRSGEQMISLAAVIFIMFVASVLEKLPRCRGPNNVFQSSARWFWVGLATVVARYYPLFKNLLDGIVDRRCELLFTARHYTHGRHLKGFCPIGFELNFALTVRLKVERLFASLVIEANPNPNF